MTQIAKPATVTIGDWSDKTIVTVELPANEKVYQIHLRKPGTKFQDAMAELEDFDDQKREESQFIIAQAKRAGTILEKLDPDDRIDFDRVNFLQEVSPIHGQRAVNIRKFIGKLQREQQRITQESIDKIFNALELVCINKRDFIEFRNSREWNIWEVQELSMGMFNAAMDAAKKLAGPQKKSQDSASGGPRSSRSDRRKSRRKS